MSVSDLVKNDLGKIAGGPVLGKYVCNYLAYKGWAYSGTFVIKKAGTYEYLTGLKGKGTYKYVEKDGKIYWLSGDLFGKGITGEYTNTKQDGPTVTLIFPKGKKNGDVQYCICKERY